MQCCAKCGESLRRCKCPDLPEKEPLGVYWHHLNRIAEEWARWLRAIGLLALLLYVAPAKAHELPGIPPENQAWYANATTNPEARPTFPHAWEKCCNHAELIPVKDIIFPTREHGWQWNDKGVVKNIPNVIIHWSEAAPDNQPTLFVYEEVMTCFYPPQGGT